MKELDSMIEEHVKWLRDKGYHENSLRNHDAEGAFRMLLKLGVESVFEDELVQIGRYPFVVSNTGVYLGTSIELMFKYSYDADDRQIYLEGLDAQLKNGVNLSLAIASYDDLWRSSEVFERLHQLSASIGSHLEHASGKSMAEKTRSTVVDTLQFIADKGYFDCIDISQNKFFDQVLRKIETGQKKVAEYHFHIPVKVSRPGFSDTTLRFQFQFNRSGPFLRLKSIFAERKNIRKESFENRLPIQPMKEGVMYVPVDRPVPIPLPTASELLRKFEKPALSETIRNLMTKPYSEKNIAHYKKRK